MKHTKIIYLSLFSIAATFMFVPVTFAQDAPVEVSSDDVSVPSETGLSEVDDIAADQTIVIDSDAASADDIVEEAGQEDMSVSGDDSSTVMQDDADEDNEEKRANTSKEKLKKAKEMLRGKATKIPMSVDQMPSLFFTHYQYKAIEQAKNKRGFVKPPTEEELAAINNGENLQLDPESRYIKLGGIVYKDKDDWTIWLNGKRVTPDAVPTQVLDLVVYQNYIEVQWMDETTNQIFPLRMKAHQRFNMDMRIFLPG